MKYTDEWHLAMEEALNIWQARADGKEVDEPCPLCLVNGEWDENGDDCPGCPICDLTGFSRCTDTPWGVWDKRRDQASAQAELDFLLKVKEFMNT